MSASILSTLDVPIIAAPMAGGPTTPDLVIAAADAGGIGFLAAGYLTPGALAAQIDAVAALSVPFGVNLFAPGPPIAERGPVEEYREALQPLAARFGVSAGEIVDNDDDHYQSKVDLVVERRIPLVSFTFALPSHSVVTRLHEAGIEVIATVADVDAAMRAAALGVDALCVQGSEAGGHRATLDVDAAPNELGVVEFVAAVRDRVATPIIAAGGIGDGPALAAALNAGADAVQIGTALLDTDEAGTKPTHRRALRDASLTETVVTRAFSGRPARALRNAFVDEFDALAPRAYPQVHHLTSPIRAAAAAVDDPQYLNLWAGTAFASVRRGPAAEIIADLWSQARTPA